MKLTINEIDNLIQETLKLMNLYYSHRDDSGKNMTIPFTLKGNIGELIVYKKLLKKFPNKEINFSGGAKPDYDILIEGKKIQIKTHFVKRDKYKSLIEECPTIKNKIIDEKKCNFIILVNLYSNNFSKIDKENIYIFNQNDFKHFSDIGCWSNKDKHDYTIRNIIELGDKLPPKYFTKVNYYNTETYRKLFESSKENWDKISIKSKF